MKIFILVLFIFLGIKAEASDLKEISKILKEKSLVIRDLKMKGQTVKAERAEKEFKEFLKKSFRKGRIFKIESDCPLLQETSFIRPSCYQSDLNRNTIHFLTSYHVTALRKFSKTGITSEQLQEKIEEAGSSTFLGEIEIVEVNFLGDKVTHTHTGITVEVYIKVKNVGEIIPYEKWTLEVEDSGHNDN